MKLLFVVDPLAGLKPYKDSSVAMMRAAVARGHVVFAAEARQLLCQRRPASLRRLRRARSAQRRRLVPRDPKPPLALKDFDAVVMRTDPPVDTDYLLATHLLGIAEANGARVLNRPACLRDFNEKLAILNFPAVHRPHSGYRRRGGNRSFSRRARTTSSSSRSPKWAAAAFSA
jgi:glutathione synthase